MKLTKNLVLAAAVSLLFAAPIAANATQMTFDFSAAGTGTNTINVSTIDQAPGSALAYGGTTAIRNAATGQGSTGFTLYYQANLSVLQNDNGDPLFTQGGTGNQFFTFASGFGEKVVSASAYPGTATFALDLANPVNYFTIYATSAAGNNLTGVGFGTGKVILSGRIVDESSSTFQVTGDAPVLLDSFGADNWNGQKSVVGAGATALTVKIDSVDSMYFTNIDLAQSLAYSFFNTSAIDPFQQVNPSKCISTDVSACTALGGGINVVGTLGTVNGGLFDGGENFLLQADANESIKVPEPATTALLGLGLAFMGMFGASRKNKKSA